MKKKCRTILRHPSGAVVVIEDDAGSTAFLEWLVRQASPFCWLRRLGFITEQTQ